jgi:hypothetical protein
VAGYDSYISVVVRLDSRSAVLVADAEVGDTKGTLECHWVEFVDTVHSSVSRSSVSSLVVVGTVVVEVVVGAVVESNPVIVVAEKGRRASMREVAHCSPAGAAVVVAADGCSSVVVALIVVAVEGCMDVVVARGDLEAEGGFGGRLGCQSNILLLPFCIPVSSFSRVVVLYSDCRCVSMS